MNLRHIKETSPTRNCVVAGDEAADWRTDSRVDAGA